MGLKEKMMDTMMGNMSSEEKKDMMNSMMEKFFSDMTDEEKQSMMQDMMPKMMGKMMGEGNMMEKMMGKKDGKGSGFNPMDMCKKMMSSMNETSNLASFATPELRGLFKEWIQQINQEILDFIKQNKSVDANKIAEHIKLSKKSVIYLLGILAQENKLELKIS